MGEISNNDLLNLALYELNNGIIIIDTPNYSFPIDLGGFDICIVTLSKVDGIWKLTDYSK